MPPRVGILIVALLLALGGVCSLWILPGGSDAPRPAGPVAEAEGAVEERGSFPVGPDVESTGSDDGLLEAALPSAERRGERSAPATLRGTVLDSRRQAIAGARLRLVRAGAEPGAAGETVSDARGGFGWSLPGPPGEAFAGCEVHAEHEDYLFTSEPVSVAGEVPECRIVMRARPRLEVRLLDADGAPLAQAGEVEAWVLDAGESETRGLDLERDGGGRYVARALLVGRLVALEGRARGWKATRVEHDRALEAEGLVQLDLVLERGWTLRGVVRERGSGQPIPYATVWAEAWRHAEDGTHPGTRADDRGRFEISGLALDRRLSPAELQGREFAVLDVDAQAEGYSPSPLERQAVVLPESGHVIEGVTIELDPAGCRFEGIARGPDGVEPAAGHLVHAFDAKHNFQFALTADDGGFSFEGLPAGSFDVLVRSMDGAPGERVFGIHRGELRPGPTASVEIVCRPGEGAIEGRVVDAAGSPAAGMTVSARSRFRSGGVTMGVADASALTDDDGRYRLEHLMEGPCGVHLDGELQGRAIASLPDGQELELGRGERRRGVDFVVAPGARIAGRVDAQDPSELRIVARAVGGEAVDSVEVGSDGAFLFARLFPAPYDLVVERADREVARATVGAQGADDLWIAVTD